MSTLPLATLDRVAAPLDVARSRLMRLVLGTRIGVFVIARRDRRVAAQAALGAVVTFLLVAWAPALMLALTPIVFGVPHVASDVRYLVLRRGIGRGVVRATLFFAALVTGARLLGNGSLEMALLCAWIATAGWLGSSQSLRRAAPAVIVAGALAVVAVPHPDATRLVLAHAHNLIAVVVWLFLFRRRIRAAILPIVLAAGLVAVLLCGVTLPVSEAHAAAFGVTLSDAARALAPSLPARAALGVVLSFAFLQSIHYAVWLGWIPQEDLAAEGTLSFKMSLRSIVRDFGPRGVALVVALSATVVGGAFVSVVHTRDLYLSLAAFHGYLEIAMLAYFLSVPRSGRA